MQKGQVHGRCAGGGGDKYRKVKCVGGAQEVNRRCTGSVREVHGRYTGGAREVVGISAERSSAWEVRGRWWG